MDNQIIINDKRPVCFVGSNDATPGPWTSQSSEVHLGSLIGVAVAFIILALILIDLSCYKIKKSGKARKMFIFKPFVCIYLPGKFFFQVLPTFSAREQIQVQSLTQERKGKFFENPLLLAIFVYVWVWIYFNINIIWQTNSNLQLQEKYNFIIFVDRMVLFLLILR